MTQLQGYLLSNELDTEIVSAYAAASQVVQAVATEPGWFVAGGFVLPKTTKARLEIVALVSAGGLTGSARLYDPTDGVDAPVAGSTVAFTNVVEGTHRSGVVSLIGANRLYLVQVQIVGASGVDKFGIVRTASLVGE